MASSIFPANIKNFVLMAGCILVISLASCCDEEDSSKGAIVQDIAVPDFLFHCISSLPDTMAIRDDSTYAAVFRIDSMERDCDEISFPAIDFSKNSVLVFPKLNGDRDYYQRFVEIDTLNKEVIYSIAVTSCYCVDKCISDNLNIVVVPRIEADYVVKFQ
jgi:hypothetical protein